MIKIKTGFSSINAWKISFEYAVQVYGITAKFPSEERYALTSQLNRAASSVSANIAEGSGRSSNKDFIRFLYIARGSLEESKSHLLFAKELGYIADSDFDAISESAEKTGFVLNGFIKYLNSKESS